MTSVRAGTDRTTEECRLLARVAIRVAIRMGGIKAERAIRYEYEELLAASSPAGTDTEEDAT